MSESKLKKKLKSPKINPPKAIIYTEDAPSISRPPSYNPMPLYSRSDSPNSNKDPYSLFSNFELTILYFMITSVFMIIDILINWQNSERLSKTIQDIQNVIGIGITVINSVFCIIMFVIRYNFKKKFLNTEKKLKLFIQIIKKIQLFIFAFMAIINICYFSIDPAPKNTIALTMYFSISFQKILVGTNFDLLDWVIVVTTDVFFIVYWKIWITKTFLIFGMTLTMLIRIILRYRYIKDNPESVTGTNSPNEYIKSIKSTNSKNVLNEDSQDKVKEELALNRLLFTEGNNADLSNKEIVDFILEKDGSPKEHPQDNCQKCSQKDIQIKQLTNIIKITNQEVNLDNLEFTEEHEMYESKFENNIDAISFNPQNCLYGLQLKDEELGSKGQGLDNKLNKNFENSEKIIQFKQNITEGKLDNCAPFERTLLRRKSICTSSLNRSDEFNKSNSILHSNFTFGGIKGRNIPYPWSVRKKIEQDRKYLANSEICSDKTHHKSNVNVYEFSQTNNIAFSGVNATTRNYQSNSNSINKNTLKTSGHSSPLNGRSKDIFVDIIKMINENVVQLNCDMKIVFSNIENIYNRNNFKSYRINKIWKILNVDLFGKSVTQEKMFKNYKDIKVLADIDCLANLYKFYTVVKHYPDLTKKIPNLINLLEKNERFFSPQKNNIQSDSEGTMKGLDSLIKNEQKNCHEVPLKDIMNIFKQMLVLFSDVKSPNIIQKYSEILASAGNLTFYYAEFKMNISVINLPTDPLLQFIMTDLSEQYLLKENLENKKFKNIMIESQTLQMKRPLEKLQNLCDLYMIEILGRKSQFTHKINFDKTLNIDSLKVTCNNYIEAEYTNLKPMLRLIIQHVNQQHITNDSLRDFSNILEDEFTQNIDVWNIKTVVDDVIDMFTYIINSKKISVNVVFNLPEVDFKWRTDERRLRIILSTLIGNSCKFMGINGKLDIIISKEKGLLKFIIKDNGRGIKYNDLCVLKKSIRSNLCSIVNSDVSGSNLNLKLARLLLNYMSPKPDNKLNIESVYEKETSVTFYIRNFLKENDKQFKQEIVVYKEKKKIKRQDWLREGYINSISFGDSSESKKNGTSSNDSFLIEENSSSRSKNSKFSNGSKRQSVNPYTYSFGKSIDLSRNSEKSEHNNNKEGLGDIDNKDCNLWYDKIMHRNNKGHKNSPSKDPQASLHRYVSVFLVINIFNIKNRKIQWRKTGDFTLIGFQRQTSKILQTWMSKVRAIRMIFFLTKRSLMSSLILPKKRNLWVLLISF